MEVSAFAGLEVGQKRHGHLGSLTGEELLDAEDLDLGEDLSVGCCCRTDTDLSTHTHASQQVRALSWPNGYRW